MSRLLALRHAPTLWNEAGRLQGRSDQPLSPAGLAAARGWRLPDFARDWPLLASPLRRARQTAAALGRPAAVEPALVEMDWGAWEGRTLAGLAAELGPALAENEARGRDFRPPGGESPREVMARLGPWLAAIGAAGRDCVAVSHKGVLRALLALATGWDFQGRPPARAEAGEALLFELDAAGRLAFRPPPLALVP